MIKCPICGSQARILNYRSSNLLFTTPETYDENGNMIPNKTNAVLEHWTCSKCGHSYETIKE